MIKFLLTLALCSLCLLAFDDIGGIPAASSSTVVVDVDGVKLTFADLERKHYGAIFQASNTFYESERKTIDEYVDEYLLERQAKKENVTIDQLLQKHVNDAIAKDPSDEALRLYYESIDTKQTLPPFEEIRGRMLDQIRRTRIAKAKAAYMKTLHTEAHVAVRLAPPRINVSLKDTPLRGSADAPVKIVEYADYECPYCQQFQPSLDKLEAEYKGRVAIAYKDVPLQMHPHAIKAAEAAHCAGVQGKYWEYHDVLFATKELEIPKLKEHAAKLKLDTKAFDQCLDTGAQEKAVEGTIGEGQTLQLQGTPSFFVNGRFFAGNLSYEQLRDVVEEELAASAARAARVAAK
jgi:protein-disulfide isomerase